MKSSRMTIWVALSLATVLAAQERGERKERPKGLGAVVGKGESHKGEPAKPAVEPKQGYETKGKGTTEKQGKKPSGGGTDTRKVLRKPTTSTNETGKGHSPVKPLGGEGPDLRAILESLNLTAEQKEKVNKLLSAHHEKRRGVLDDKKLDPEKKAAYLIELRHRLHKALTEILTEEQVAKLEAALEQEGAPKGGRASAGRPKEGGAKGGETQKPFPKHGGEDGQKPEGGDGRKPDIRKELGLNEEQAKTFHELHQKWETASGAIHRDKELTEEQRKARLYEAWKHHDSKLRELLTQEQYKKLEQSRAKASELPGVPPKTKEKAGPTQRGGGADNPVDPTKRPLEPLPTPKSSTSVKPSARVQIGLGRI